MELTKDHNKTLVFKSQILPKIIFGHLLLPTVLSSLFQEFAGGRLTFNNTPSLTQGLHQGIQQYPACDNNSQKVAQSLLLLVIRSFE